MNILVIGGGLLGRRVAEMLDAAGHDVAVIDESEDNIAQLDADFGGVTSVDVYKRQMLSPPTRRRSCYFSALLRSNRGFASQTSPLRWMQRSSHFPRE